MTMGWEEILDRFPSAYMVEAETKEAEAKAVAEACEAGLPCVIVSGGNVARLVCFTNGMKREAGW